MILVDNDINCSGEIKFEDLFDSSVENKPKIS